MATKVISFIEKREVKERENRNKLMMPIYDFYIPYNEIPFWEQIAQTMQQAKWTQGIKQNAADVNEFTTAFILDIEMYREFGDTLEKFRFLFNHLELYFLHHVLMQIEVKEHEEELQHYRTFLAELLKENEELSRLIQ